MSELPLSARQPVKSALSPAAWSILPAHRKDHHESSARCATCPVRGDGFCQGLSKRLHARFAAMTTPVTQTADHWYWDEESVPHFVGVVREGFLRMLRYSADGRRRISGIAGPGSIVGEATSGRRGYGLETSTQVSMCIVERSAFRRLMDEEPEFRRSLRAEQDRLLDVLRRHIWSRGIQTPEERLSAFLSQACETLPCEPLADGRWILAVDIPRADIADLLGTTRETISRITRQWQAQGLIDIPDARHFLIRDPDGLAEMGGVLRAVRPPTFRDSASDDLSSKGGANPRRVRRKALAVGRAKIEAVVATLRSRQRRIRSYL